LRCGAADYWQGGAVPSVHITGGPDGTTTVVWRGGGGSLLLKLTHPPSIKGGNSRSRRRVRIGGCPRGRKYSLAKRTVLNVSLLARWWGAVGTDHGRSWRHDDGILMWRGRIAAAEAEAATEGKRKQKQNETRHTHLIGPHETSITKMRLRWPIQCRLPVLRDNNGNGVGARL
jgi:hypothetical protein